MLLSKYQARYLSITFKTTHVITRNIFSSTESYNKVTSNIVASLKGIVGDRNVSTADVVKEQHSHDLSHHDASLPDVVVFPESVVQVSSVAKLCNDNRLPIIPFGSGTGVEGGVNAVKGGVCVDMVKMDKIVEVNDQDFDCSLQPGVLRSTLNNYIRDTGLFFPIDPGTDCSLCGMCATSASGTNAVRYGTMRENVLNLQVVLSDGRVIDTAGKGRRTKKTVAGYNLTNLFVGSEGTLGIITQATLRLYGIPEKTIVAVCHFKTVQEAVNTVVQILQCGVPMARLEFLDDSAIEAFNKYSNFKMPVAHSLFLEFHGPAIGLEDQFKTVKDMITLNNGSGIEVAVDANERNRLWKARNDMVFATLALVPGSKPYVTDTCVPISKLPEIIVKSKEMIVNANLLGPIVGHVGDGNFHVIFPIKPTEKEHLKKVSQIAKQIALLSMDMNGTCTGEHGIGLGKLDLLVKEIGNHGVQAMKQVKLALDPNGIMNPGKIFP